MGATGDSAWRPSRFRDPATQAVALREAPYGRTEAHALHQAAHADQFGAFERGAHEAIPVAGRQSSPQLLPESATTPSDPQVTTL